MRYLKIMKKNKILNFLKQADVIAENSHDAETQVGCIIINPTSYTQISAGYNGFVRNSKDDELPNTAPDKYKYILHAEDNALLNANYNGHCTKDCVAVVTLSPCINCLRRLKQAGIKEIFFRTKYKDFNENCAMKDIDFLLTNFKKYYRIRFI